MPYIAEISRANPTAILFLIDQSGSMDEAMPSVQSKAQFVADALNRTLATLIIRCSKEGGVRDYFDIGVLAYGEDKRVENGLQVAALSSVVLNPISAIEASPLRVEERLRKFDDGAGGILEQQVKFPVWLDPKANGGTPMCLALYRAADVLAEWCDAHRQSYPPTVIHITDGEPTDGDPEQMAENLRQICTDDGPVLLFNLHACTQQADTALYPPSDLGLPNVYSKLLFRMSSILPDHIIRYAQEKGIPTQAEARGFVYNADASDITSFFDIGTRAAQLR